MHVLELINIPVIGLSNIHVLVLQVKSNALGYFYRVKK